MSKSRQEYNEYMREYMLKRYHARRTEAIQTLGGSCASCGSTKGLEFDHVDPEDFGLSIGKMWSCSEAKFKQELTRLQLLCSNCHKEKSNQEYSEWSKKSGPRICECGKEFPSHAVYAGHRRQNH